MIDPDFLEILACPNCGGKLEESEGTLRCRGGDGCGLVYPIEDGIPILLVEEAKKPGHEATDEDA